MATSQETPKAKTAKKLPFEQNLTLDFGRTNKGRISVKLRNGKRVFESFANLENKRYRLADESLKMLSKGVALSAIMRNPNEYQDRFIKSKKK